MLARPRCAACCASAGAKRAQRGAAFIRSGVSLGGKMALMQAIGYFSAKTAMGTRRGCKLGVLCAPTKTLCPAFPAYDARNQPRITPPKSAAASVVRGASGRAASQ